MDGRQEQVAEDVVQRVGLEGTVKWFDPQKGYGFIVGPEDEDVFVHYSEIIANGFRMLREGTLVRYDAELSSKGWSARSVVCVEPPLALPTDLNPNPQFCPETEHR